MSSWFEERRLNQAADNEERRKDRRFEADMRREERRVLGALPARELWQHAHGRSRSVDLDALYGPGTVCLQARLELVVLLAWTLDGNGFAVRRLDVHSTLARWPIFYKDLGVFDLDRAVVDVESVGNTSAAINGIMTTAAMSTTCTATERGTVYHFCDPTLMDGSTTSPNMSRGTVISLLPLTTDGEPEKTADYSQSQKRVSTKTAGCDPAMQSIS